MARDDFPCRRCKVILQSIVVPKLSVPPPRRVARSKTRRLDMQNNDVNAAAVNGKEAAYFGVPWEEADG
jgi:hypothetical protein